MRLTLTLLLLGLLSQVAVAQSRSLGTTDFFSATPASPLTDMAPARRARKMPWVERYELRTETRDFDLDRQELTFRITPSTPGKRKAQAALYDHLAAVPDLAEAEDQCDALADRYLSWTELYALNAEQKLLSELAVIQADRKTVLDRKAAAGSPDFGDLIDWRKDVTDREVRQLSLQLAEEQLRSLNGLNTAELQFNDLIDLEEIQRRVTAATYNLTDPELAYDLEKVARELALERAEKRQYLDFAQLKYQGPSDNPGREKFSIGVGLQLPTDGDDLLKVRELELEQKALQGEQKRDLAQAKFDWQRRQQNLLAKLKQVEQLAQIYSAEAVELDRIKAIMLQQESVQPLPVLELMERRIRNDLRLLDLRSDVYEDYLGLLQRNGLLCDAGAGELIR